MPKKSIFPTVGRWFEASRAREHCRNEIAGARIFYKELGRSVAGAAHMV
jgi:hypothetical protein